LIKMWGGWISVRKFFPQPQIFTSAPRAIEMSPSSYLSVLAGTTETHTPPKVCASILDSLLGLNDADEHLPRRTPEQKLTIPIYLYSVLRTGMIQSGHQGKCKSMHDMAAVPVGHPLQWIFL
jgi:hypothetical protein